MTQHGHPEPQDRRPGDQPPPGARAEMPVIGDAGVMPSPAPESPAAAPRSAPSGGGARRAPQMLFNVFGDNRRSGRWRVPGEIQAWSVFGDTVLDLREAEFDGDEVVVHSGSLFGDTVVVVPPGTAVELGGFTLFGDTRHDNRPGTPAAGFPRVRITGYALFGDVRVKEREVGEVEQKWWAKAKKSLES